MLDLNDVLPPELVIKGVDSHVYRIGLSLYKPIYYVKRNRFSKPIYILFICILYIIRSLISITFNDTLSRYFHLYIGDLLYFLNLSITGNLIIILALCMQLYYNSFIIIITKMV